MRNIKEINIKNRTYYFLNDLINIKNFDSNLLKIDIKSYKHSDIYYIGYVTLKSISDHESICSEIPLYLIISKVDVYIEDSNGDKYLVFASTDKIKEVLTKYAELLHEIKNLIKRVNDKPGEYEQDFMKIRFE